MLGLLKLGETDKKEHEQIWSTILEDKLARKSSSTTMSYFMKLNDWNYGFEGKMRKADSVFLNPEEIIQSKASNQISSALTPPAINILIPNNVQGSLPKREAPSPALSLTSNTSRGALSPNSNSNSSIPANYNKPLPINLSTLLPVSKNNLGDVSTRNGLEMPKFGLNIPGFQECRALSSSMAPTTSASNSICQQQQRIKTPSVTPIIQWPGIEAVIESYKKYSQDVTDQLCQLRDLQTKLQGDISTKRTVIDNLSSQMATLARYQAEKRSKNKEMEEVITKLSENLARLN